MHDMAGIGRSRILSEYYNISRTKAVGIHREHVIDFQSRYTILEEMSLWHLVTLMFI